MQESPIAHTLLLLALGCSAGAPRASAPAASDPDSGNQGAGSGKRGAEADPDGDQQRVRFRVRVPQPGHVSVVETTQSSRVELSQRRGQQRASVLQANHQRTKVRSTVVSASDEAVLEKRVEYLEGEHEQRIGDRLQEIPNPLIGKTYRLKFDRGTFRATDPAGDAVSEYEQELLLKDNPHLGKPSQFAALMPDHPIAPGERLDAEAAALAEAFGQQGVQVSDVHFTLQRTVSQAGQQLGVFELGMTTVQTTEQTVNEIRLEGTVALEAATCWPVEVELAGQLQVEGRPPNPSALQGAGEIEMRVVSSYR